MTVTLKKLFLFHYRACNSTILLTSISSLYRIDCKTLIFSSYQWITFAFDISSKKKYNFIFFRIWTFTIVLIAIKWLAGSLFWGKDSFCFLLRFTFDVLFQFTYLFLQYAKTIISLLHFKLFLYWWVLIFDFQLDNPKIFL